MKMNRVFLKLSGKALAGPKKTGLDEETVKEVARQVKLSVDTGIQVRVVIGGDNFQGGRTSETIDRTKVDRIGMLATVMSCIYVSELFRDEGMMTQILTPFECGSMTKLFSKNRANKYFQKGVVVFFAEGTGHPYFSTDTGIALRAAEIDTDCIFLAKAIDGVYDNDPKVNPQTRKYDTISIQEVISQRLVVVSPIASIMCTEHETPVAVFSLNEENGITSAIQGQVNGTVMAAQEEILLSSDGTILTGGVYGGIKTL